MANRKGGKIGRTIEAEWSTVKLRCHWMWALFKSQKQILFDLHNDAFFHYSVHRGCFLKSVGGGGGNFHFCRKFVRAPKVAMVGSAPLHSPSPHPPSRPPVLEGSRSTLFLPALQYSVVVVLAKTKDGNAAPEKCVPSRTLVVSPHAQPRTRCSPHPALSVKVRHVLFYSLLTFTYT